MGLLKLAAELRLALLLLGNSAFQLVKYNGMLLIDSYHLARLLLCKQRAKLVELGEKLVALGFELVERLAEIVALRLQLLQGELQVEALAL